MKDYEIESKPRCPSCRKTLDRASCTFGETTAPTPGDFTICLCCGAIMRYTDDMQFKICDQADIKKACADDLGEKLLKISIAVAPIAKKIQERNIAKN